MDPGRPGETLRLGTSRGKSALAATILGSGMAFLDSTAVNVALPEIGRTLGADFAGFQWIVNAYLLSLGALVLIGGTLGDTFGRRRIFLLGNAWFAGASLLCGLAPDTGLLIGFRLLQGVGAALMIPASLALLRSCFPENEQGQAVGLWSGLTGLAVLAGPLLGGWFVDTLSWRPVFFINPVLAAAVFLLARRSLPEAREASAGRPDWPGALAVAVALGGLTFALIRGPQSGWLVPDVLWALGAGALGAAAFLRIESRSEAPMFPLGLLRRRQFAFVNMVTLFIYFTLSGVFFLLVITLQTVHGYSALGAGLTLAPVTLLLLVLSPLAGKFADRRGPRLPMTAGPLVAAAGAALLAGVADYRSFARDVLPGVTLLGAGLGVTVAPLTSAALAALEERHSGLASGVNNAVARIAQLLAIPVLPLLAGLSGLQDTGDPAFAAGVGRAMWIGAALLAFGGCLSGLTVRKAPAD